MAALVIVQVDVTDPEKFEKYRRQVPSVIEKYGGRYLVRGGATEAVEGSWSPPRLVVLEFPSLEQAKKWYSSADYAPLLELRKQSARTTMTFAEGT